MDKSRSFEALRVPVFRRYWIVQAMSLAGTWIHYVAQGWLVYSLSHSPFYLGLNGAALATPMFLFSMVGGHMADRFSKRLLLLCLYSLATIPPMLLFIFTITKTVTVWHCIAIAFTIGTLNALEFPTRQAFLVELVGKRRILNAVALSSAAFNTARMIGPLIAGMLIPLIGVGVCFVINTLSFIPLLFVLKTLKIESPPARAFTGSIASGFAEVARFIFQRREIILVISTVFIFSLLGLPYHHFLPVFADRVFGRGPEGLGMLMSAAGFGALSAALVLSAIGEPKNKKRYMSLSAVGFPLALFMFSINKNFFFHFFSYTLPGFQW